MGQGYAGVIVGYAKKFVDRTIIVIRCCICNYAPVISRRPTQRDDRNPKLYFAPYSTAAAPGLRACKLPKIKRFTEYHPQVVVIATCRRQASGGKFRGSLASQLEVLSKAASAGCQLLDLELQSASKCKPEQLQRLRSKAALIISFHEPCRLLQNRRHRDHALRQRNNDEVPGKAK